MDERGYRMKRKRESLGLKFRDVEEASNLIATQKNSDEYVINLSRLSDIENRGTVPTIFRMYSLCTIYRVDMIEALDWYGVSVSTQAADARLISVGKTHPIGFSSSPWGEVQLPISLEPGIDLKRTVLLNRMIQKWGKLPLSFLGNLDFKTLRYAFVGSEDWRMYPIIYPESLLLIDASQRKIASSGWANEYDRPIYFLEHRSGFFVGWCCAIDKHIVIVPHPASQCEPLILMAAETDVIGQVTGVANHLDSSLRSPSAK